MKTVNSPLYPPLYPELFNDVFGPCHHLGSASHTGAPCCAGLLAHSMLTSPVKNIVIQRDPDSSFVHYQGMWNSEIAMLNGAAGRKTDCPGFYEIEKYTGEHLPEDWERPLCVVDFD